MERFFISQTQGQSWINNNNTLLQQITLHSRIRNLHFSIIKISNKLQATIQPKVSGQNIFEIKLTRDRQRQYSVNT